MTRTLIGMRSCLADPWICLVGLRIKSIRSEVEFGLREAKKRIDVMI